MANASITNLLKFDPGWITDPPPESFWNRFQDRINDRQVIDIVKAQLDAKRLILTAERTALDAQVKALDGMLKANELASRIVGGLK